MVKLRISVMLRNAGDCVKEALFGGALQYDNELRHMEYPMGKNKQ